jgi:hypothetical protein
VGVFFPILLNLLFFRILGEGVFSLWLVMSNVVVDVGLTLQAEPQVCDYMTACDLYMTGDVIPGTVTVEST